MGKRNRKALSAILDGGTSSLPVKTQTVKNSEKTSKKPVTAKIEKSKKDEDFENFLKEEDPELLEFAQNDWDLSDQSDDEADETENSDQNLDDSAGTDFSKRKNFREIDDVIAHNFGKLSVKVLI